MEVENPTSDVAGSDLNRLALGLGIQPSASVPRMVRKSLNPLAVGVGVRSSPSVIPTNFVLSQSPRGRGRYSTQGMGGGRYGTG